MSSVVLGHSWRMKLRTTKIFSISERNCKQFNSDPNNQMVCIVLFEDKVSVTIDLNSI